MTEAFRTGKDVHRQTASMLLSKAPEAVTPIERQIGKVCTYALDQGGAVSAD